MNPELLPILATALFAGLLGSGHCFGMCGGIASGLGTLVRHRPLQAVAFHCGRLFSYVLLGVLVASLLSVAVSSPQLPLWGRALRLLTALLIAAVGLQLMTGWRLLAWLERSGGWAWRRIAPLATRLSSRDDAMGRLALGCCWGLLPCGLVYTMLVAAGASAQPLHGGLVMLAFGVGTLPAMLGMSLAAPALAGILSDRWTRRLVGAGLLLLALWSVLFALAGPAAHH